MEVVGALDGVLQWPVAVYQLACPALDARPDPEQVGRGRLRVQIPQEGAGALAGREVGQVDRGGGLADAALDVVRGEDLHVRPALITVAIRRVFVALVNR